MSSSEYTTFIQWKDTDLCMNFVCPNCGERSHFDGFFIYAVRCWSCKKVYRMPTEIKSLLVEMTSQDQAEEDCIKEGEPG